MNVNRMRRDRLVVGIVLAVLSLLLGWGYFIRTLECMGYLPISPPISPEYCGGPTPLPYYMAAIFATLILAGLVLIIWPVIGSPQVPKNNTKEEKTGVPSIQQSLILGASLVPVAMVGGIAYVPYRHFSRKKPAPRTFVPAT